MRRHFERMGNRLFGCPGVDVFDAFGGVHGVGQQLDFDLTEVMFAGLDFEEVYSWGDAVEEEGSVGLGVGRVGSIVEGEACGVDGGSGQRLGEEEAASDGGVKWLRGCWLIGGTWCWWCEGEEEGGKEGKDCKDEFRRHFSGELFLDILMIIEDNVVL